ncbi:hypothetical protein D9M70_614440 [compost metagenome]
MNGCLGANIDAFGRLIENDDLWIGGKPFANNDLLLISTRKRSDRYGKCCSAEIKTFGIFARQLELFCHAQKSIARGASKRG